MSNLPSIKENSVLAMGEEDLKILRRSKFKEFTNEEIAYSARISNLFGLNPLLNQIHFVRRRNKDGSYSITPQTSIDGLRLIAQRARGHAGTDDAIFEYGSTDKDRIRPLKASVTVYRLVDGHKCSFTGSARWDEFYTPIGGMWDRMKHVMLGKCAEAQALRKAFPAELSGLYAEEEMGSADRPRKAEEIQAEVVGDAPEDFEEPKASPVILPISQPVQAPPCSHCGSPDTAWGKFNKNNYYCRACKERTIITTGLES